MRNKLLNTITVCSCSHVPLKRTGEPGHGGRDGGEATGVECIQQHQHVGVLGRRTGPGHDAVRLGVLVQARLKQDGQHHVQVGPVEQQAEEWERQRRRYRAFGVVQKPINRREFG